MNHAHMQQQQQQQMYMASNNDKEQKYFEKTVQLFNENKLTTNILLNTSKPVFDLFGQWILYNVSELGKKPMFANQIQILRRMKYGICHSCTHIIDLYNSIDILDLDFDIADTKWEKRQMGSTVIHYLYKIDGNGKKIRKLFSYNKYGHMYYFPYKKNVICNECAEKNEKKEKESQMKKQMKKSKCKVAETVCSICIDPIVLYDKQIRLKCSHAFHPGCITEWTAQKSNCPCCRFDIVS
jgi:hypothetical protein